jgi:8-oxo-dGTP pyrophosphatase MutT (NUDIX family)
MGGFRKLEETIVHRGFRIEVAVARFETPDGSVVERDLVHHPGAVAVVPLHEDGTVTLVSQFRTALDHELLELPAGVRDVVGELEATTANRELAEEVGLHAAELEHLITFHSSPGFCDEAIWVFLGTGLTDVPHRREGPEEEAMVVHRVPLAAALAMVADGRITDAKTVIGLTLAADRLR